MDVDNISVNGNINQLVECPRCGERFELSETFRAHFEAEKRREINTALRENEERIYAEAEKANQAKLEESAEQIQALEEQSRADHEAQEKREKQIRAEAEKANQATLEESAKQIQALKEQLQADHEAREKREKQIRAKAEEDAARKFDIERGERNIENQRLEKQLADMRRKLRQRSGELQGEALEVYLKQQLQTTFPIDKITDIRQGQYGADLKQEVFDGVLNACGIVVWEAKRTKNWSDNWLAKVKDDADRVGAHLRVIVSETLPDDIRVFALREGVWISSIEGALPLALALRSQLIESTRLQRAIQGQGLKMDAIYQYLTSPRFSERIQRMVETWKALEEQVSSEERSMQRQWKERRKQLARMQDSTIEMFTDFSSILGQEIPQVPGLEPEALPPGDDAEVNN